MKVSILVPIYNVEKYIERCVDSLMVQIYDDIEYIFVNDQTKDDSISVLKNVIEKYAQRKQFTKIINHDHNRGLGAARITGLNAAHGDYVMFVDSDDFLEPNAVELMVKKIEEDRSDVVITAFNHVFENKVIPDVPKEIHESEYLARLLKREVSLNVWARLYRRSLFSENNISFIEGINMGEDYVVTSRLFYYVKKISYIQEPLYNYLHINDNSYTTSFKHKSMEEVLTAQKIIENFYLNIGNKQLQKQHYIGNLKLKAELLILMLRSSNHNSIDYKIINKLFSDEFYNEDDLMKNLKLQDRYIIKLSRKLPEFIMSPFVKLGFVIKQLLKI